MLQKLKQIKVNKQRNSFILSYFNCCLCIYRFICIRLALHRKHCFISDINWSGMKLGTVLGTVYW